MHARRMSAGRHQLLRLACAALVAAAFGPVASADADPLTAGGPDCGGDAFSSAQVIEKGPPRRGPLIATPQTMCADLEPQQPPANVEIGVFPSIGRGRGSRGYDAPY